MRPITGSWMASTTRAMMKIAPMMPNDSFTTSP
jgi:hypothetical protein